MNTVPSRIMQQMLDVNRYAALPFVETGRYNDIGLWLAGLRQRLDGLLADVDRATVEVAGLSPGDGEQWTQAEQLAFGEFLSREYPNEHSAGVIALGDAWKDGKRFGVALASQHTIKDRPYPHATESTHGIVSATGELTPAGQALAHAIAAAVGGVPRAAKTVA